MTYTNTQLSNADLKRSLLLLNNIFTKESPSTLSSLKKTKKRKKTKKSTSLNSNSLNSKKTQKTKKRKKSTNVNNTRKSLNSQKTIKTVKTIKSTNINNTRKSLNSKKTQKTKKSMNVNNIRKSLNSKKSNSKSKFINNTNNSLFHTFYNNKNDYNNTIKRKFKTTTLDDLRLNLDEFKRISVGKSGSKVYFIEHKYKKYILKYDNITDQFKNEILIHLDISVKQNSNICPNITEYGYLYKGNKQYYYYIVDFIDGYDIKHLYQSNIIHSINILKKLYIDFIREYARLNKKLGFAHRDIKSDNFIYDKKSKSLILIDMGLAYTDKYPYSLKLKVMKRWIEVPFKHYIYPFRNKNKTSFNYSFHLFKSNKNNAYKSMKKLNTSVIDIVHILKLYNTGVRFLFKSNGQIQIDNHDAKQLNSDKIPFYKKLKYVIRLIQVTHGNNYFN